MTVENFWRTCPFVECNADGVYCKGHYGYGYNWCKNFGRKEQCDYMKLHSSICCIHCGKKNDTDDEWHKVRIFAGTNDEGRMVDVCPDCHEIYWNGMKEFMQDFLNMK